MTREERLTYWQGIINQYRESGLSGAAFCKEHNINPEGSTTGAVAYKAIVCKKMEVFLSLFPAPHKGIQDPSISTLQMAFR